MEFTKDGKIYKLKVKIDKINKCWFKDKITNWGFEPVQGSDFEIYVEDELESHNWYERKKMSYLSNVESTQWRSTGFLLILVAFLLILSADTVYIIYKKKAQEEVNWVQIVFLSILVLMLTTIGIIFLGG